MTFDVHGLLRLWGDALPSSDGEAVEAFRRYYHDPVVVNGAAMTCSELVARARAVQATFASREITLLHVVETPEDVAFAFRMGGVQTGPLNTSLGVLPPTGQKIELRVIDILRLTEGRVSEIHMVADELGPLAAIGAVSWAR
jgi:hypothetical protein